MFPFFLEKSKIFGRINVGQKCGKTFDEVWWYLTSALSTLKRTLTTLSVSSAQVTSLKGQPSSICDSLSPMDFIRAEISNIGFNFNLRWWSCYLPPDTWYAKRNIFSVFQRINFLIMGIIVEAICITSQLSSISSHSRLATATLPWSHHNCLCNSLTLPSFVGKIDWAQTVALANNLSSSSFVSFNLEKIVVSEFLKLDG